MSRTKSTLEKRVAKVFRAVKKLERKGHNKDGDYDYTRATDVFEEVRDRLFGDGILLMRDEAPAEYVDRETNGDGLLQECRLSVTYSFSDGATETKPLRCNGLARDLSDKSLPKAQTGADKAFLKRFGLMAEVVDDPEFDGDQAETLDDIAPPKQSRRDKHLNEAQIANVQEACVLTKKTDDEVSRYVAANCYAPSLREVKQKYFKQLIVWASDGKGTLTTPKPEAAPALQLSLPKPVPPIELKIGNKSIEIPAQKGSYAL